MATQLRRVLGLPALASLISFGALVAFSAVNLAVIRTHLISETCHRNLAGLLRYGLVPLVGMSLAYLMVLTGGFRRPVRMVNFSEAA